MLARSSSASTLPIAMRLLLSVRSLHTVVAPDLPVREQVHQQAADPPETSAAMPDLQAALYRRHLARM